MARRCSACASADFEEIEHVDGVSPAWPLSYETFEPYYTAAEKLFHVHGARGEDPNEPPSTAGFPHPAVSHEPLIQDLHDRFGRQGLHPFHLPLGVLMDERDGKVTPTSICIRCNAFDGFPCLLNGKADAQVMCVDPTLAAYPNFTLLTGAYADVLETDASGRTVTGVQVIRNGERERYTADVVVVACGALSSALLLLRSANAAHPDGLANGSGQVGRNYMRHNQSVLMAFTPKPNDTVFQKTLGVSDFYFGSDDWDYPLGLIQMCAASDAEQIKGEALPMWLQWFPDTPFSEMAHRSMDFWLSSEDLPRPREPHLLRRGQGRPRRQGEQHGGAPPPPEEASAAARRRLGQGAAAGAAAVSGQEHPDQRHRPPGRHLPLRRRPCDQRARRELQGARAGTTSMSPTPASSPPSGR